MALIVIITPGSLTVSSDVQRAELCTVPTVPDGMDSTCYLIPPTNSSTDSTCIFPGPDQNDMSITTVLISNTYIAPFQTSACGTGASACNYVVSFDAPAFGCTDVTNQTDFSDSRLATWNSSINALAPNLIWEGTTFYSGGGDPSGDVIGISVLTHDLVKGALQANNCTAYRATYAVEVTLADQSASAQIQSLSLKSILKAENTFISVFGMFAVDLLYSQAAAGPNGYLDLDGPAVAGFFITTPEGNHTWSDNITHILSSYMQNVSVSLLSGTIYTGICNDTATNFLYIDSTCFRTIGAYVYNPVRLLTTYGVALAIVFLAAIPGGWLVLRRGSEKKPLFSHIVQIVLNEDLFQTSKDMRKSTPLRLESSRRGETKKASSII